MRSKLIYLSLRICVSWHFAYSSGTKMWRCLLYSEMSTDLSGLGRRGEKRSPSRWPFRKYHPVVWMCLGYHPPERILSYFRLTMTTILTGTRDCKIGMRRRAGSIGVMTRSFPSTQTNLAYKLVQDVLILTLHNMAFREEPWPLISRCNNLYFEYRLVFRFTSLVRQEQWGYTSNTY